MSLPWTNKCIITKDLSFIQGHVPGSVDTVVGNKPPIYNIQEDTEEEFYAEYCMGDTDFQSGPDLTSIRTMLDEVCSYKETKIQEENEHIIEISKLNPLASEFFSRNHHANDNTITKVTKRKTQMPARNKRERNAAVQSILQGIAANDTMRTISIQNQESVKLLKPEDFMNKNTYKLTDATDKISNKSTREQKVVINPTLMFKKKSMNNIMFNEKSAENTRLQQKNTPASGTFTQYKPSTLAEEYYKDFEDRVRVRELVREDIWTRAEKQMKEIDTKRKAEVSPLSNSPPLPPDLFRQDLPVEERIRVATILLPQHRHLLTGECIVCKVISNCLIKKFKISENSLPSEKRNDL